MSLSLALDRVASRRLARIIFGFVLFLGIVLVLAGSLPAHPVLLGVVFAASIVAFFFRKGRIRKVAASLFALSVLVLVVVEYLHRRMPKLEHLPDAPIYVIGDSVSSGTQSEVDPWPIVLSNELGRPVINLAKPGAVTRDLLSVMEKVPKGKECIILFEVGGNDQFSGHSSKVYEDSLRELLAARGSWKTHLVLFEIPLMPFHAGYGRVQRRIALDNPACDLIPKSVLASVMATRGATLDGIHLSEEGHRLLARRVAELLKR